MAESKDKTKKRAAALARARKKASKEKPKKTVMTLENKLTKVDTKTGKKEVMHDSGKKYYSNKYYQSNKK